MITEVKKQKIAEKLANYVSKYESQARAANSLRDVSAATINHMLNGKWQLIKEEMWRNVASQIGYKDEEWVTVETRDFRLLTTFLRDAQDNSLVIAITGEAGTGKSVALRKYAEENKNAYLIKCNEYWNRKTFLQEVLTTLGRDYSGYTVAEMMAEVVKYLKATENPELIFDEFDKVSDQILYFFITLYNMLEDHCGIVLCATDHLAKRIKRGLKINKKGYKEIYSRIGRKFIELKGLSSADITQICIANGIDSKELIKGVIEDCEGDLRRVKRKIHALKQQLNAA
jgi:DNA transposition AAA+ family ATPase